MDDYSHLERKDDNETAGLVSTKRAHNINTGSERLHEMKRISHLITDVSPQLVCLSLRY